MLARVLNADERTRLADEDAGDIGFALLWSAKEAAFKAAKKVQATLVFAPGRWQLECADLVMADGIKRGSVIIPDHRSEEHTSELQSLMRISYAVFCWKKKTKTIYQLQELHITTQEYKL